MTDHHIYVFLFFLFYYNVHEIVLLLLLMLLLLLFFYIFLNGRDGSYNADVLKLIYPIASHTHSGSTNLIHLEI